ncbi:MAG: protein kinase [Planctomycetes bacterium]|nr:protein kinase [Planctomycetota bacterium]
MSKGLLADVYRGHYERLGVPVAVKVLSPKAMAQGVNKDRFIREGRALAQLQHPNIIKIYNVGHEHGRYFIIMDWIQDGMNLRQLAQQRPLTPPQSLKVVQRLCDALTYIHARSMIHRDIKPANICLRRGGHPVIMDFSLMKDQSSDVQLTAPGTIMGTVNFMPPEQAQPGAAFGNVSPQSDVYSLGGTLYWLLTGKPPFKGRTPMETIIKLMREDPQPPSAHNPSLPPVVDQLVLACMSKKQEGRPASAEAFKQRLDELFRNHRVELEQSQRPGLAESSGNAGGAKTSTGRQPQQAQGQHPHAQQPPQAHQAPQQHAPQHFQGPAGLGQPAQFGAQPLPQANPGSSWGKAQSGTHGHPQPAAVATAASSGEHGRGEANQPFSPSMSTEGAAAGLLRMPEGLDFAQPAPQRFPEPDSDPGPDEDSDEDHAPRRSSRRQTSVGRAEPKGKGGLLLIALVVLVLLAGGLGVAYFLELIPF